MPKNGKPEIAIGSWFGRLKIISMSHQDKRWRKHYLCRCECGNEKTIQGSLLASGNTKSCGCLVKDTRSATRVPNNHSEITAVILGYKRHAKGRGYTWELSREQAENLFRSDCHYCGSPPANIKIHKNTVNPFSYSGIDRINNKLGYVQGNVVPCCNICNRAKRDMDVTEFYDWALRISDFAIQWGSPAQMEIAA